MSKFFHRRPRLGPTGNLPSPGFFFEWAAFLIVLFAVSHIAGLREFTSVLNGTVGSTNMDSQIAALMGITYVFLYLGAVLVVPVFVLAALLLMIWKTAVARKKLLLNHEEAEDCKSRS